jgi:polysaccharide biosynthesis protein PslF
MIDMRSMGPARAQQNCVRDQSTRTLPGRATRPTGNLRQAPCYGDAAVRWLIVVPARHRPGKVRAHGFGTPFPTGTSVTSYGLLGTYPPTLCGLASFTAALRRAVAPDGSGDRAAVVRIIDAPVFASQPEVVEHLRIGQPGAHVAAAAALNRHDVAIVQHDDDSFGGLDGDEVLAVVERLTIPCVVVLHAVPRVPTPHQRSVLERLVAAVDAVVTMTEAGRQRLVAGYAVANADKVTVIPHGADVTGPRHSTGDGRPTILTWGLLRPGKGIEWALIGLREIRRLLPTPRYVVAGQTHPKALAKAGEAYRISLATRARALGVTNLVRFERGYLQQERLARMVSHADVVLLPFDSGEQVTSGVLIEALAARKPVVSTVFPHAVELLSGGAGILVPYRDGAAIAAALSRILTDPGLAARMSREAGRVASGSNWPAVAARYRSLAADLLAAAR